MNGFSGLVTTLRSIQLGANTAYAYVFALAVFVGTLVVLKLLQMIVLSRLVKVAARTKTDLDDVVIDIFKKVRPPFYVLIAFYLALQPLQLPHVVSLLVRIAFVAAVLYEIVRALERLLNYFVDRYFIDKDHDGRPDSDAPMVNGVRAVLRIVLWTIGVAVALSNLGVNITSIIASLGIGGVAVALAVQNILGDIFSSFSIYLDKPFQVGDFIVIGNDMGVVERIGLKSTRLQTLQGEQLVVANKELTSVRVQNFKQMQRRRVVFSFGIEYGTPAAKVEAAPGWVKDIIDAQDKATFDRCHFNAFGDSSLDFETVYFVETDDYNAYMDINQSIYLSMYEKFSAEGVEFAFPTRTVHLVGQGAA